MAGLIGSASCAVGTGVAPGVSGGSVRGAGRLEAGAAVRVITPDLGDPDRPVYIGGLRRSWKASGVHDDLYARALVLSDAGGSSVGLVVLDLIGFFHDDVEAVRAKLGRQHPEVRLDYLVVASTHTHAGPDVLGLWMPIGSTVDGGYIARVRSAAVEAVAEAWSRRRAVVLSVGVGSAPGLSQDTRLPRLTDDHVLVMGLRSANGGEPVAALVNWNSHPSVSGKDNREISADFPRSVIRVMETRWGGTALYASGALGGQIGSGRLRLIDPETGLRPPSRLRLAELVGERIGEIALGALRAAESSGEAGPPPRLKVRSRAIRIPLDNPRFTTGLAIGLIRPRRLYPRDGIGAGWLPSELPDPNSLRPGAFTMRSEVGVVDLGPARWALVPGELYPELSLGRFQEPQDPGADFQGVALEPPLRPQSDLPLFVICLANDELGYIIPRSQWDDEPPYAYGRSRPQYGEKNSSGPLTAPVIMKTLSEILTND